MTTSASVLAAVAAAAGVAEGTNVSIDAAFIKANFPDVAAALVAEGSKAGADAERARISGIEAAALPGHEAIIKAHKDDPAKTPADAAMAIIAAENAARGSQMAALDKDETQVKVRSEPANPAPAAADAADKAQGPDLWRAEYAASKDLQAEFAEVSHYVAFKQASEKGQIKYVSKRAGAAA